MCEVIVTIVVILAIAFMVVIAVGWALGFDGMVDSDDMDQMRREYERKSKKPSV